MDRAGNEAFFIQQIVFTNPLPPMVQIPATLLLPCGAPVDDLRNVNELVDDGVISHPCNRSMDVSYQDSVGRKSCGITFTRFWSVTDDCGLSVGTQQTVRILELQMPDAPQDGQVNLGLHAMLRWPHYPGSVEYKLYIWPAEMPLRQQMPSLVTMSLTYRPSLPFIPNTRYLWQVEYVLDGDSSEFLNVTEVPGPVWGFETRTFADFSVTEVNVPSIAFSGQDLTISWTVTNIGSRGSAISSWYDALYLSLNPVFDGTARRVLRQRRSSFLDPADGYMSETTLRLQQNTIGLYYVFIITDEWRWIDDYDRVNNLGRSDSPVDIRLTPPPDLVVTNVFIPESGYSGKHRKLKYLRI